MIETTRLSTKGQVVLPKSVRAEHNWRPGTEFVVEDGDGYVTLRARARRGAGTWHHLVGCLRYAGPRKTIRAMDAAVAAEARRHK